MKLKLLDEYSLFKDESHIQNFATLVQIMYGDRFMYRDFRKFIDSYEFAAIFVLAIFIDSDEMQTISYEGLDLKGIYDYLVFKNNYSQRIYLKVIKNLLSHEYKQSLEDFDSDTDYVIKNSIDIALCNYDKVMDTFDLVTEVIVNAIEAELVPDFTRGFNNLGVCL